MFFSNNAFSANRPRKPLVHASLAPLLSSALLIGCGADRVADPNTMSIPLDGSSMPDSAMGDAGTAPDSGMLADASDFADAGTEVGDAAVEEDSAVATSGEIRVNISGLRDTTGKLAWGLFDESRAGTFPEGLPARGDWIPIPATSFALDIPDVVAGRYAVMLYHDRNDNGQLDRGIFGQPTEDWGSTNNITYPFSAPGFDESAIEVTSGFRTETDIRMHR